MKTTTRLCAYCQEPFAGRADKLYCSSSCKSKDFRCQQAEATLKPTGEEPEEEAPRRASGGPYAPVAMREPFLRPARRGAPTPADEEPEGEDEADEDEEFDAAKYLRQTIGRALNKRKLQQLPLQYGPCIEKILAAHDQCLSSRQLRALRTSIGDTLHAYKYQASRCQLPASLIQHVTNLYRFQELVAEAWQAPTEDYKGFLLQKDGFTR